MKITGPEGLQQPRPEKDHLKKDPIGAIGFGNALRKALETPDMNSEVRKLSRLAEPHAAERFGEPVLEPVYIDKTSRVINLMDAYARSLSNPQKTLKDIEPDLTAFIKEARSLREEYMNAGNANPELMTILEDLLRTARLEGVRFQRGDYLDPE